MLNQTQIQNQNVQNLKFNHLDIDLKFVICNLILLLFFVLPKSAFAVNTPRYWVGGAGTWNGSDTTHWSDSSGGAGGQTVPDTDDDVYFDLHSNESSDAAYDVTIATNAVNAANLSFARAGDPTTGGIVTVMGSTGSVNVYGNLTLHSGQVWSYSSTLTFKPATGVTAVVTGNSVRVVGSVVINGAGTVQLAAGTLNLGGSLTLTAGTLDATTNSSTALISGTTPTLTGTFTGSNAFYNLTRTPNTAAKTDTLTLAGDIEVTNTFTVSDGATVTNRVLVDSSVIGTARTITAAAISISNADFRDITGAGAASWDMSAASGGSGNCGGNSMKSLGDAAFTATQTQYWTHGSNASANWSTTGSAALGYWDASDHTTHQRVPLCQDNVIFDAGSFAANGKTIVADMSRLGKTIDFRDTDQTFTLSWSSSYDVSIYGGLYIDDNTTVGSGAYYIIFEGRGAYELLSSGKTIGKPIKIMAPGGSITIQDALNLGSSGIALANGGFYANDKNVTIGYLRGYYDTTRAFDLGDGLWTINENTDPWLIGYPTKLTLDVGASTVKITGTFTQNRQIYNGSTFNNIWLSQSGGYAVEFSGAGNTNFNGNFKMDAGESVKLAGGSTYNIGSATLVGADGSPITIYSSNTTNYIFNKTGGGTVCADWLVVSDMTATPGSTWYMGANSLDNGGGNTGMTWGVGACGGSETSPAVKAKGGIKIRGGAKIR
jgi:hypothetical protein